MKSCFILTACLFSVMVANTQTPGKVIADKIVGYIGDKVILHSDINQKILELRRRNQPIPGNAYCRVLQQQLGLKALLLQAERDSMRISDAAIEEEFERRVTHHLPFYTHKQTFSKPTPSIDQLKATWNPFLPDQLMVKRMMEKITAPVSITPREVFRYFAAKQQDSLPIYDTEIELGEIIRYPLTSRAAEQAAIDTLNALRILLINRAAKFDVLARRYSDDPSAKTMGGIIQISRNDPALPKTIIDQVFRLQEGELSPVFRSPLGHHLILLESKYGDDAHIRHILRIPVPDGHATRQAIYKLDSIRSQLVAGTLTFKAAVAQFSEAPSKWQGGFLQNAHGSTDLRFDDLNNEQATQLFNASLLPGEYSAPHIFNDPMGREAVRIFYLKSKSPQHRQNLRADYTRISAEALEAKKQQTLHQWITDKTSTLLITIAPSCTALPEMLVAPGLPFPEI